MLRLIPDWVLYIAALGIILFVVFRPSDDAPPSPPEGIVKEGGLLPPASPFDERILVQVSAPRDGIGSAFAVNSEGDWLTARHVVDGCETVAILVAPERYLEVDRVIVSDRNDLAVLQTDISPYPVTLNVKEDLEIGERGYHIGYPQGRPGEVASRLMSRSKLVIRGERRSSESVLTWAESGRTEGLDGTLGGLSGGPVYDADGYVRGVIVAESPRRGRIYSASPASVRQFLDENNIPLQGEPARPIKLTSYGNDADFARRRLQVVKVACEVSEE